MTKYKKKSDQTLLCNKKRDETERKTTNNTNKQKHLQFVHKSIWKTFDFVILLK